MRGHLGVPQSLRVTLLCGPHNSCNSLRITSLADPHTLTPIESHPYEKTGEGGTLSPRPPFFCMFFQVPYAPSPSFATLTKTHGGYSSHSGTHYWSRAARYLNPSGCTRLPTPKNPSRVACGRFQWTVTVTEAEVRPNWLVASRVYVVVAGGTTMTLPLLPRKGPTWGVMIL